MRDNSLELLGGGRRRAKTTSRNKTPTRTLFSLQVPNFNGRNLYCTSLPRGTNIAQQQKTSLYPAHRAEVETQNTHYMYNVKSFCMMFVLCRARRPAIIFIIYNSFKTADCIIKYLMAAQHIIYTCVRARD